MLTYSLIYLAALLTALVTTPAMAYLARRTRLMDRPGTRKVHTSPVPRIGGIAIIIATLAVILPVLFMNERFGEAFRRVRPEMLVMLATSCAMGLVGFIDDTFNLRARYKLLAQLVMALVVCWFGIRIQHISVQGWFMWQLGLLSWPLSVLWIVGVTNAVNLIDGLDGLAAGISAITCAIIAVFAFYAGEMVMGILMLAVLGSLSGFLFFNFNPAKIFLGDSGSFFLGFMLAVASVFCAIKSYMLVGLMLPALALGLPLMDTVNVMVRRVMERRPIFAPDRGHLHHRLLDKGFQHRQVVIMMHAATLLAAVIGLGLIVARDVMAVVVLACAVLPLVLVARVVGGMDLHQFWQTLKRNRSLAREIRKDSENFQKLQLRLREAKTDADWWQAMRRAGRFLGLSRVALTIHRSPDRVASLVWNRSPACNSGNILKVAFIAYPFGAECPSDVALEMPVTKSVESAGRKLALLGRLLDEQVEIVWTLGPDQPRASRPSPLDFRPYPGPTSPSPKDPRMIP